MSGREILHFHLFAGLGGAARGFNRGAARVGQTSARFRCIGGVDVDRAAAGDFARLVGAPGTVLDLFDRAQYEAFHGAPPPEGWREATAEDIREAAGGERPHVLFLSPPCKGFSGLLSEARSKSDRYQALNRLTVRGLALALEAWGDDPPEFVLLENVPRIANRGRSLLETIEALLVSHGYAVAETTHDCGELGNLAQTRKRFLLVARHREKVPPFLYEPPKRPLRGVGEVIGPLPLPGDELAGPMHRMRRLQWKTWVRLAFVEAGKDWRSLERLRVLDGMLEDYGLMPARDWYRTALGVTRWGDPANTVTAEARPQNGAFSVADPRIEQSGEYGQLGVQRWEDPAHAVTAGTSPGQGWFSIADPRLTENPNRYWNHTFVAEWKSPARTVIGGTKPCGGAASVADPRFGHGPNGPHFNNVYRVIRWADPSMTVTAGTSPSAGGLAVADPRPGLSGERFATAGHYGVVPWDAPSRAVLGSGKHDNGPFNVADPRLPASTEQLVALIIAEDGTWHRPFTTLELASLQGLVDPGEWLELEGTSDTDHRERIGNAVPSPAAAAIASVMGRALLLAWAGETFSLDSMPVWVRRKLAIAASVESP